MRIAIRIIVIIALAAAAYVIFQNRKVAGANNRAVALINDGQYEEAIRLLRGVSQERPGDPLVYKNIGAAYEAWERMPEAIEAYRRSLALKPDQAQIRQVVDAWQYEQDLLLRAQQRVERMTAEGWEPEADVTFDDIMNQASAQKQMDKHAEAIVLLERALFLEPANTQIEEQIELHEAALAAEAREAREEGGGME